MMQITIQQAINTALECYNAGRLNQAEAICRQIIVQDPNHADALHMLGLIAGRAGNHKTAVELIGRAIQINPSAAEYQVHLGLSLFSLGRLDEAVNAYRSALKLKPDIPEIYNNLGNALKIQGDMQSAIEAYQKALQLRPDFAMAHNNLGNAFKDQLKLDEALAEYLIALQYRPDLGQIHSNLGNIYKSQGKLREASARFLKAMELEPGYTGAASNYLYNLYFYISDPKTIYDEHVRWNLLQAQPLAKFIQVHGNDCDPERRLRIGYVSPDFRMHCQSFFTIPLLSNHDHKQFKIYIYLNVIRSDQLTDRLRGYADVWRNIAGLSDEQTADLIREDQIDVLVDLTMHMADSTPLVFARKPAPIQVAWLAYPGTTGLRTIDSRLTDPHLDPPGSFDAFYSEESIRLPDTFWCYDPLTDEPQINELPALKNGYITFGCLNNFCKVNDDVLQLWSRVLAALPNCRMILLVPNGSVRQEVRAKFATNNITAQQVEFTDFLPREVYLKLYNRIDLALDTFPYNGHTTSLDSYWMGVPVVTLIGNTVVGRAGWSQLCNLDLKELAAQTPEEFIRIAVELANNLPRLKELRRTLRDRMENSPLMNAKRFAHNVETAYRAMWRKWASGPQTM